MDKSRLLLAASITALSMTSAAKMPEGEKQFSFSVDPLILQYSGTSLDYALEDYPNNGDVAEIEPGFDAGIRLNAGLQISDQSMTVSLTSYSSDEEDEISDTGASLIGTLYNDAFGGVSQSSIGRASAEWEMDYTNLDFGSGHQLLDSDHLGIELVGGLRLTDTSESFDVVYADSATAPTSFSTINQEVEVSGIGPYIGVKPTYHFTDNVKMVTSLTYSPLLSSTERNFVYTGSSPEADITDETDETIQSVTMSVGIEGRVLDVLDLGIGYEANILQGYPEYMKHTNESGEIVLDHGDTEMALSGVYLRAGATF